MITVPDRILASPYVSFSDFTMAPVTGDPINEEKLIGMKTTLRRSPREDKSSVILATAVSGSDISAPEKT